MTPDRAGQGTLLLTDEEWEEIRARQDHKLRRTLSAEIHSKQGQLAKVEERIIGRGEELEVITLGGEE